MNTIKHFLFIGIILFAVSCKKDSTTERTDKTTDTYLDDKEEFELQILNKMDTDMRTLYTQNQENKGSMKAAISYNGQLCPDSPEVDGAVKNSINSIDQMDYWSFYGIAGSLVTVDVTRLSCGMDPIAWVFEGTAATSEDVSALPFVAAGDDDVAPPEVCDGTCFAWYDPNFSFVLPNTGYYTVRVADFASCGYDPLSYQITLTGNICDSDGDGCNDDEDPHPNSIMDATVVIDGCDSGVDNVFVTSCSTMSDLIADCAASANNHGQFVSCVASLTNDWKSDGLISGKEKGKIQSCAAGSNIP
nr:hypothetical protein [Bacteroidota bacterium]